MAIKYVSADTTTLYKNATDNDRILDLLWGDRVKVESNSGTRAKVKARGVTGYVKKTDLGDTSLLEVYFIDVGQGDGILIRTPDHRHLMIDGGYKRASQPTGKNAADFVDWKFVKDYGETTIQLDALIASHNDADHYGGLWDLLDVSQSAELNASGVTVEACYHAGVAWWKKGASGRSLGKVSSDSNFFVQLMTNRTQVKAALATGADPALQGEWAKFMKAVVDTKKADGSPTPIQRLSHVNGFVPGFDGSDGGPAIHVLAPVEFTADGKPAVRRLGSSDSWNTNGNSLLFRLDYGRSRMLLTGDLNSRSQKFLLEDYTGQRQAFECDVAKACHHGSDDVSYEFLSAMRPAVTIISSGDNEGHDHPRPGIVAASATTGYLSIIDDRIATPLVYSTELARSVSFGHPTKISVPNNGGMIQAADGALDNVDIEFKETKAGDLRPQTKTRKLGQTLVVAGQIYGLVNVRTDGNTILCATMNEKDYSWQIKKFESRF